MGDACEEEEDDDMGLEEFSVSFSSSSSKGRKDKDEGKERTLHEKMMDLMTLQTASGHFAENKMIGDIIGKPLEDLKAQVPDSNPDSIKILDHGHCGCIPGAEMSRGEGSLADECEQ